MGPSSLELLDCFTVLNKGPLPFCDGTTNAEKYINILVNICADVHAFFKIDDSKATLCPRYKRMTGEEEDTGTGTGLD